MARNIKAYRKEQEKLGRGFKEISPHTFFLPGEYSLFVDYFHHHPREKWIIKPASKSQGQGITIIQSKEELKRVIDDIRRPDPQTMILRFQQQQPVPIEYFVASKYIEKPLLIGGKKFDLRIYVLVTSFKPLKVFLYEHSFARFCSEAYNPDDHSEESLHTHLTNVAIQKYSPVYNSSHGGKWDFNLLRTYLQNIYGKRAIAKMEEDLLHVIITALKSVQNKIVNDVHCFECYGYDVILDESLRPWLLEVNASPSMTTTTVKDKVLKKSLINDVLNLVMWEKAKMTNMNRECSNFFRLVHNE